MSDLHYNILHGTSPFHLGSSSSSNSFSFYKARPKMASRPANTGVPKSRTRWAAAPGWPVLEEAAPPEDVADVGRVEPPDSEPLPVDVGFDDRVDVDWSSEVVKLPQRASRDCSHWNCWARAWLPELRVALTHASYQNRHIWPGTDWM